MINWGGGIDLLSKWFVHQTSKIRWFLLDSARPIHHNNVNARKHIIVIDDGLSGLSGWPLP